MYRRKSALLWISEFHNFLKKLFRKDFKNSKDEFDKISRTIQAENLFYKENFSRRLQQE